MSPLVKRLLVAISVTTACVVAVIILSPKRTSSGAMVAVTTHPLLDLVSSVAGNDIAVEAIMPPGSNPHSFEPSPSSIALLSNVRVIYAIGHGFDDWIDPILQESPAQKVVVDTNIRLRKTASTIADEQSGEEDEEGPIDPHYWLDARNAITIAKTVADDLTARFPDKADSIAENLTLTISRLESTDQEVRSLLAGMKFKKIVTLHDAWYYFAEAYGLEVIGSFEPSAAREPSPTYLSTLEDAVRASGTKTLYTESNTATASIKAFAEDNGMMIVELDPIEGATDGGYNEVMRRNAKTISNRQ